MKKAVKGDLCAESFLPSLRFSVIFPNIPIRPVEEVLVLVEFVFEERLPEGLLHLTFAGVSVLPAVEPDIPDDLVDIVHNPLHDDRGLIVPGLLEKFGEGGLPPFFRRR